MCVSLIVKLDSEQCSLQKMGLAANCMQANTLKGQLALTGNTSSPGCQSFLLGLGLCPCFDGSTITLSVELVSQYQAETE